MPASLPVSVIVPTKNSAQFLEACLKSIQEQTYKNIEIIVVIPEKKIEFVLVSEQDHFRLVYCDQGKNASRNAGVEVAQGTYVLHLDDDMVLDKEVISDCVNLSQSYRAVVIPENEDPNQGFYGRVRALEKKIVMSDKHILAPRFLEKALYEDVGGINVQLDPVDEGDLKAKLEEQGIEGGVTKSIIAISSQNRMSTLFGRWSHMYQRGRKAPLFNALHPTSNQLKPFQRVNPYFENLKLLAANPIRGMILVVIKTIDLLSLELGSFKVSKEDKQAIANIRNKVVFEAEAGSYQKEFFEDTLGARYVNDKEAALVEKYLGRFSKDARISVLDIGAGGGRWSKLILDHFPNATVCAYDLSVGMVENLRTIFVNEPRFTAVQGNMEALDAFTDGQFDLVISIRALKYAQNTERVLSEVHRVLKDGGVFIAEYPYFNGVYRMIKKFGIFGKLHEYANRISLISNEERIQHFKHADFKVSEVQTYFTVPSTVYKHIKSRLMLRVLNFLDAILPLKYFGRSLFVQAEKSKTVISKNNLFSIVITTKNKYQMLKDELDCLKRQTYKNFKVYIVDDASEDETKDFDAAQYKDFLPVYLARNKVTENMIKTRNAGLKMCDKDSDYLMILDDDNKFEDDFLEKLNVFVNRYANFGLIEPKNYHRDRKSIWYYGCNYNLSTLFPHFGRSEFENDYQIVDAVANCFLINARLLKQIGLFDEKYIIDFSEAEYAYRAKSAGFDTCVANVPIYHQSTTGEEKLEMFTKRIETRPETYFYTFRNKYLFVSEFGTAWNKLMFYSVFQFITMLGYAFISFKVKSMKLFGLYFKGFLAGNRYIFTNSLTEYTK